MQGQDLGAVAGPLTDRDRAGRETVPRFGFLVRTCQPAPPSPLHRGPRAVMYLELPERRPTAPVLASHRRQSDPVIVGKPWGGDSVCPLEQTSSDGASLGCEFQPLQRHQKNKVTGWGWVGGSAPSLFSLL